MIILSLFISLFFFYSISIFILIVNKSILFFSLFYLFTTSPSSPLRANTQVCPYFPFPLFTSSGKHAGLPLLTLLPLYLFGQTRRFAPTYPFTSLPFYLFTLLPFHLFTFFPLLFLNVIHYSLLYPTSFGWCWGAVV